VLEHAALQPEHVTTIHIQIGQRLDRVRSNPDPHILGQLGLQAERFLLYPANFWPHKNHRMLLTAFAIYHARHPHSSLKLVCTGTPDAPMQSIRDAAERMGLATRIVFPGYLADEDFRVVLQACLALIFPSLYEGFGMPLLEAMALGKPVLCSNVTSLPEIAGEAALLFDPRKPADIVHAMERIESDAALRLHLIRQGAQRLPALGNPERMAQQYLHVFRTVGAR
jgi:glycosyltransferase involved in cell wall biosynthesis